MVETFPGDGKSTSVKLAENSSPVATANNLELKPKPAVPESNMDSESELIKVAEKIVEKFFEVSREQSNFDGAAKAVTSLFSWIARKYLEAAQPEAENSNPSFKIALVRLIVSRLANSTEDFTAFLGDKTVVDADFLYQQRLKILANLLDEIALQGAANSLDQHLDGFDKLLSHQQSFKKKCRRFIFMLLQENAAIELYRLHQISILERNGKPFIELAEKHKISHKEVFEKVGELLEGFKLLFEKVKNYEEGLKLQLQWYITVKVILALANESIGFECEPPSELEQGKVSRVESVIVKVCKDKISISAVSE